MSVPYIHTFYTPKGYYFYDFNTNAIVRINKSVYDFLNEWEKNKDCPNSQSECGNIIDELKRAGFLSERHWTKIEHPATKMLDRYLHSSVESITLQVTQQCNLKCNYCPYSGSYYNREHSNRHMSFETAKQAIDFYIAHSFDIPVAHIGFYGGEPLIEYDYIDENGNLSHFSVSIRKDEMNERLRKEAQENAEKQIEKTRENARKKAEQIAEKLEEKAEEAKEDGEKIAISEGIQDENEIVKDRAEKLLSEKLENATDGEVYLDNEDMQVIIDAAQNREAVTTNTSSEVGKNFDFKI